jgi:hypothetical protein
VYNLNTKPKICIINFALEAERAINYLPVTDQDHFRWQVAKELNTLHIYNTYFSHTAKLENKLIRQIQEKLKKGQDCKSKQRRPYHNSKHRRL